MHSKWIHVSVAVVVIAVVACGEEPPEWMDTDSGKDKGPPVDTDTGVDTGPVVPLGKLVGKTYRIEFDPGYWDVPTDGIGEEIGRNVPPFVFQITSVDEEASTFTALFGTGVVGGGQDLCNKTVEVTGTLTTTDKTHFDFDPVDLKMIITGSVHPDDPPTADPMQLVTPVHNFAVGGDFANQGDKLKRGTITALLDSRDVACMFVQLTEPTPESFCATISEEYEYDCEACMYNGAAAGSYCVTLGANLFFTDAVPNATVQPVSDFDMKCVNDDRCGK